MLQLKSEVGLNGDLRAEDKLEAEPDIALEIVRLRRVRARLKFRLIGAEIERVSAVVSQVVETVPPRQWKHALQEKIELSESPYVKMLLAALREMISESERKRVRLTD